MTTEKYPHYTMATQLSKEQAITVFNSKCWEDWDYRKKAEFQMIQDKLCMPFEVYREAVEKTLGRPVYTHEFGLNKQGLIDELFEGKDPPSFEDVMDLIPKDKQPIIVKIP